MFLTVEDIITGTASVLEWNHMRFMQAVIYVLPTSVQIVVFEIHLITHLSNVFDVPRVIILLVFLQMLERLMAAIYHAQAIEMY